MRRPWPTGGAVEPNKKILRTEHGILIGTFDSNVGEIEFKIVSVLI